jgi:hypothetical protein
MKVIMSAMEDGALVLAYWTNRKTFMWSDWESMKGRKVGAEDKR